MTAAVLRAHAAHLPLPDASVDLIVTSPPYFGLRSYTDGGAHYAGQIGSEGTPGEWLEALWACTAEWVRVLKPEGSLFVNLGDKYAGSGGNGNSGLSHSYAGDVEHIRPNRGAHWGHAPKSLLGLPWRYAIGCTDRLGLILRAEIVWAKPNGLPESVADRVRRAHEQIFHLVKQPRYYAAVDEIREPHTMRPQRRPNGRPIDITPRQGQPRQSWPTAQRDEVGLDGHPLGKLPGSVWHIPSQPLSVPAALGVDHFAAFPMELPRRLILGWSPPGVCTACAQGRRPVVAQNRETFYGNGRHRSGAQQVKDGAAIVGWAHDEKWRTQTAITGYACGCPEPSAPTRPAVVLDPFGGTGTTALVASVLGRHGITADLSSDYCRLAAWRTTDPGERARAMQVPKPPPVPEGMDTLFEMTP